MAGAYPEGTECNMRGDPVASEYVVRHLPRNVRTFFLGNEVGQATSYFVLSPLFSI